MMTLKLSEADRSTLLLALNLANEYERSLIACQTDITTDGKATIAESRRNITAFKRLRDRLSRAQ